ncbi:hypothetical protein [Bradyrhizobium sp.]|uniref:hypothetical protein n=1 Tax=Bradyrhizobium sp. TaxID=376 RepID=UPI003C1A5E40
MRDLRMLLCARSVSVALGVVALAVMFSGGAMGLAGVFVTFGSLVVLVFRREIVVELSAPAAGWDEPAIQDNTPALERPETNRVSGLAAVIPGHIEDANHGAPRNRGYSFAPKIRFRQRTQR